MKLLQQAEALGLLGLTVLAYYHYYPTGWSLFAILFFVPDSSFLGYAFSTKFGAYWYNTFHHQGIIGMAICAGVIMPYSLLQQAGIIFLAHSFFDRIFGYGLKFTDSFQHTHLGWIGKSKP